MNTNWKENGHVSILGAWPYMAMLGLLSIGLSPQVVRALDCNGNGVDDATDIAQGSSHDCNTNGVPDECEDEGFRVIFDDEAPEGPTPPGTYEVSWYFADSCLHQSVVLVRTICHEACPGNPNPCDTDPGAPDCCQLVPDYDQQTGIYTSPDYFSND